MSGVEKFSFWQIRFVLGWGPRSKLDDGLEAWPKGYRWRFKEFTLFYALGLGWDWQGLCDGPKTLPTADTLAQ